MKAGNPLQRETRCQARTPAAAGRSRTAKALRGVRLRPSCESSGSTCTSDKENTPIVRIGAWAGAARRESAGVASQAPSRCLLPSGLYRRLRSSTGSCAAQQRRSARGLYRRSGIGPAGPHPAPKAVRLSQQLYIAGDRRKGRRLRRGWDVESLRWQPFLRKGQEDQRWVNSVSPGPGCDQVEITVGRIAGAACSFGRRVQGALQDLALEPSYPSSLSQASRPGPALPHEERPSRQRNRPSRRYRPPHPTSLPRQRRQLSSGRPCGRL
jgi:hypothetical protein